MILRNYSAALTVAALPLALIACSGTTSEPEVLKVSGTVHVVHGVTTNSMPDGFCRVRETYSHRDVAEGAPVVIYNSKGQALAKSTLGAGIKKNADDDSATSDLGCDFGFTAEVPSGEGIYAIDVAGRGHTDPETIFSAHELAAATITVSNNSYSKPPSK